MSLDEFRNLFSTYRSTAFRLQRLTRYTVESEAVEFQSYLSGEPLPSRNGNRWLEQMAANSRAGKVLTNVHVLPPALTPYLGYEIDWWYAYWSQAGAEVRFVLPDADPQIIGGLPRDFWLFDDAVAVAMEYDSEGRFLGPKRIDDGDAVDRYRVAKSDAVRHSVDIRTFLARRRQGQY